MVAIEALDKGFNPPSMLKQASHKSLSQISAGVRIEFGLQWGDEPRSAQALSIHFTNVVQHRCEYSTQRGSKLTTS